MRRAKGAASSAEPPPGEEVTTIVIKMPDGKRLSRRFRKESPMRCVVDWVASSDPEMYEFDLVRNYPRRELGVESWNISLDDLGLHPAVTLFTKERSDSE